MKYVIALLLPFAIMSCGSNEVATNVEEATNAVGDMGSAVAEQATEAMNEAGEAISGAEGMASLNETVEAITAAGGLTKLSPDAATSTIDTWVGKLEGMEGTASVVENLKALKTELTAATIDGKKVGALLTTLGNETAAMGADNMALMGLSKALTAGGEQLSK